MAPKLKATAPPEAAGDLRVELLKRESGVVIMLGTGICKTVRRGWILWQVHFYGGSSFYNDRDRETKTVGRGRRTPKPVSQPMPTPALAGPSRISETPVALG